MYHTRVHRQCIGSAASIACSTVHQLSWLGVNTCVMSRRTNLCLPTSRHTPLNRGNLVFLIYLYHFRYFISVTLVTYKELMQKRTSKRDFFNSIV
jgi:hypothetical protein